MDRRPWTTPGKFPLVQVFLLLQLYPRTIIFVQTILIATSANILAQPVEYLKGVGPQRADLLKKELAIFTFNDLLHHFPFRHVDKTKVTKIIDLHPASEYALVQGKLWYYEIAGERSGRRLLAYLKDDTGVIELTWFKGLNWIEKMLKQDETYLAFGKIGFFMGKPQIVHPELEVISNQSNGAAKNFLEPVYPATEKLKARGLGGRQLGKITQSLFAVLSQKDLSENLPAVLIKKLQLLPRYEAYRNIHFPSSPQLYEQALRI